ncbi:hypothetical protein EVAR_304_1 [Eumeta japonica]|uniref:Uncharacterized protein n=1 Tax=Eumeta variegata TaxID=151549 RepID=A0A4C1S9R8_EUMVA|nr:hypothetical protein EVAR_304_1 [Eumeta japonica]
MPAPVPYESRVQPHPQAAVRGVGAKSVGRIHGFSKFRNSVSLFVRNGSIVPNLKLDDESRSAFWTRVGRRRLMTPHLPEKLSILGTLDIARSGSTTSTPTVSGQSRAGADDAVCLRHRATGLALLYSLRICPMSACELQ